jgi:hypothetical protein
VANEPRDDHPLRPDPVITVGAERAFFRADMLRQLRKAVDEQVSRKDSRRC